MSPDPTPLAPSINADDIRAQLKCLLEDDVFRSSRRCSQLLEYLVENSLRGETTSPKERTLGIEVFDREPSYDTANDPVVRSAANEIRKRIAQYYHKPGHENEIQFDLPTGSYLPEFHLPAQAAARESVQPLPSARRRISPYYVIVALLVLALAVGNIILLRAPTALDRFWSPVLDSPNRLLICVNSTSNPPVDQLITAKQGAEENHVPATAARNSGMPFVGLTDNQALISVVKYLTIQKANFEVQYQMANSNLPDDYIQPSLDELRKGPTVFLGGSDWTFRTMPSLRFHNKTDAATGVTYIEDSQNPSNKKWGIKLDQSFLDYTEDYGTVTRLADSTTGQVQVFICGIGLHGTGAAGEFATNSSLMKEVASGTGSEWQKRNVQIVISTKVAGKAWGTPQLVAKYFW